PVVAGEEIETEERDRIDEHQGELEGVIGAGPERQHAGGDECRRHRHAPPGEEAEARDEARRRRCGGRTQRGLLSHAAAPRTLPSSRALSLSKGRGTWVLVPNPSTVAA